MNRISGSLVLGSGEPADGVYCGFLRVGCACCAWATLGEHQYAVRFDSRTEIIETLRAATKMVGEGGYTWFLAAIIAQQIRRGLINE